MKKSKSSVLAGWSKILLLCGAIGLLCFHCTCKSEKEKPVKTEETRAITPPTISEDNADWASAAFKDLVMEQSTLPRPDPSRKLTVDEYLEEIVKPRAAFAKKVEEAYANGSIDEIQYKMLILVNRQNALPK